MYDRFDGIRISLTQIGSAGRGNGALNARLPEDGAVGNSYQLEFSQDPHELLRFPVPTPDLTGEDQAR